MDLTFQVPMQYCSLQHQTFLSPSDTSTAEHRFLFGSASLFFLELFLCSSPVPYWTPADLANSSIMSYLFALPYCSWGSWGKNTEVVCHSLLQWTTFCQTSPPWPVRLGWPHTVWLSFIELDKAVVRVFRLASFLWLWFQAVCPLIPSLSAYHLTWVSLTLDMWSLFTAVPAKRSHCSLPLMRVSSSRIYHWLQYNLSVSTSSSSVEYKCQWGWDLCLFTENLE